MDHKDFIVGKRYKGKVTQCVVACVGHTTSGIAIFEADDFIFKVGSPSNWVEVKEPREYWIIKTHPKARGVVCTTEKGARSFFNKSVWSASEVIHVREVV